MTRKEEENKKKIRPIPNGFKRFLLLVLLLLSDGGGKFSTFYGGGARLSIRRKDSQNI